MANYLNLDLNQSINLDGLPESSGKKAGTMEVKKENKRAYLEKIKMIMVRHRIPIERIVEMLRKMERAVLCELLSIDRRISGGVREPPSESPDGCWLARLDSVWVACGRCSDLTNGDEEAGVRGCSPILLC